MGSGEASPGATLRAQLVQQLLAERRQRLEEKLELEPPYEDRPRSLLPSFDTVLTPRQSFSAQDIQTAPTSCFTDCLWEEPATEEACQRFGKDLHKASPFCRHCGSEDTPLSFVDATDGYVRSTSSRSFKERLRDSSLQYQQKLDLRRRAQEVELTKHCTFHPAINSRSQVLGSRARGCYAEALPERLGPSEARRRSSLRDQAKEILQADDLYECTFTPRINRPSAGSQPDGRVPLHLRTKAIQEHKQEKIRASQEAKLKQSHPFAPQISARSQRLAQRRHIAGAARRCRSLEAPPQDALGNSSQRTLVNPGKASQASVHPQDFLARQVSFEKERQYRKEVRQQHASACCSFRPQISDQSEKLTACNVELIGETPEDRIERLAVKDVNRRQLKQQELRASLDRDCTFRPALSPQSQAIAMSRRASSPSVHQRLYDDAKSSEIRGNPRRERQNFQPQLDPRSLKRFAHVKPHYGTALRRLLAEVVSVEQRQVLCREDIMATLQQESVRQQQDRKAELLLKRHEERMLAETVNCTFRPELCTAPAADGAPVVVSGLGRFFELKSLAQRQDLEQRAHEAKAFRRCAHGPPMGITIPEPFALSQCNSWSNSSA